eukprot:Transcript_12636.p1 GENE.Transcript_12636~~Transcript_12636.p1  ORF type:complete len:453 (+),score=59.97 Transcript_12636:1586-2944(+)
MLASLASVAGAQPLLPVRADVSSSLSDGWDDGSPAWRPALRAQLSKTRGETTCHNYSILRSRAQLHAEATREQRTRLKRALPLVWVHVPKAGSAFVNTLMHHVGICPQWPSCGTLLPGEDVYSMFATYNHSILCEDAFPADYSPPGHDSAGPALTAHGADHGAIMIRQPEQRTLAAHTSGWPVPSMSRDLPLATYANVTAGCTVKMISRTPKSFAKRGDQNNFCAFDDTAPTDSEVELAISRLRDFAFVGLAEQWDASICLFHAQFGGSCHDFESPHTQPGEAHQASEQKLRDVSEVPRDPFDGTLYAAAENIFRGRLRKYGIEPGQPCPYCTDHSVLLNEPGCLKETLTGMNSWYPNRGAHESDCAYMCSNPNRPRLQTCVASDFTAEDSNGRCDLFFCGNAAAERLEVEGPPQRSTPSAASARPSPSPNPLLSLRAAASPSPLPVDDDGF